MIGANLLFNRTPSLQVPSSVTPADRLKPPSLFQWLGSLVQRVPALRDVRIKTRTRRLRLQEIVQMGDKRFVAILRVDEQEFLLGGSAGALSILGTLTPQPEPQSFAASLAQAQAAHPGQPAQVQP